MKKKKLKARKTSAVLKKDLDKVFSEYVRRIHANQDGNGKCYTCGKILHWKQLQCGHFISRTYLATRFDERNVRPQCVGCNLFGNGQQVEFARRLNHEESGITEELYRAAQKIVRDFPYEAMIANYKDRISRL